MPKLVPLHSVVVARPDPKKIKDKDGNIVHVRETAVVGKPFDFTEDEVEDLKASGHRFRTPRNETSGDEEMRMGDADDLDRASAEAEAEAVAATKGKGAKLDAAGTAKAGAKGNAKPPTVVTGTPDPDEIDDEEL